MTDQKARIARQFVEAIPHAHALGMRIVEFGEGRCVLSMDYDLRFVGDPATGVIHGGAVFALLDTACGAAVMLHPSGPAGTATLDLRVDYQRSATPGQRIVAEAICYNTTRTVAFIRATARDDDAARPVATAAGAFSIESALGPERVERR